MATMTFVKQLNGATQFKEKNTALVVKSSDSNRIFTDIPGMSP